MQEENVFKCFLFSAVGLSEGIGKGRAGNMLTNRSELINVKTLTDRKVVGEGIVNELPVK